MTSRPAALFFPFPNSLSDFREEGTDADATDVGADFATAVTGIDIFFARGAVGPFDGFATDGAAVVFLAGAGLDAPLVVGC